MAVISVNNLQVNYGQINALKHVNFDIMKKEFIGIIGPNGGGKTTLVKTILGLVKSVGGEISIQKGEVVGYVPQLTTFDRDFPITVKEVILLGHLPKQIRLGFKFPEHETSHALSVMKRLRIDGLANQQIGTLSGGQMQRVLVARALMNHPTILILDEPTAGVDEESKHEIYKMLNELNESMTIMMITHDTIDLFQYLDRVIYINKTAHIHNKVSDELGQGLKNYEGCPIDWFVKGEKINKELNND
jgi:zinc transport system ATP-binding protein